MKDVSIRSVIENLYSEYGMLLDEGRLEDWLSLFLEEARYEIVPRENSELNLPVALMRCDNLNMLRDRITSLRSANEYNIHWSRRIIGRPRIQEEGEGSYRVDCAYFVVQTNQEGQSRLFSAGAYQDKVKVESDTALFVVKKVIVDTFCIPTLLAIPL